MHVFILQVKKERAKWATAATEFVEKADVLNVDTVLMTAGPGPEVPMDSDSATCWNCLQDKSATKTCTRCRQAYYCSKECLRKHWKVHKKSCKK